MQSSQQETLVHIVSILNVTRYAAQVNRHSINILMDTAKATSHDINNFYNLTMSSATSINFHQLILHIRSVFANLHDSLDYIQMVSVHTMDYIDATMSGTLSLQVLLVMDLQKMLLHILDALPPMLHLPVSPDDTIHFYRYLHTHVLIKNKQFLLLIDVPIQDRSQQIHIHELLTLSIPHGNFSAHYNINTKYLGVTKDATMVVELSTTQFRVCQEANGQFCSITTFSTFSKPTILCHCSVCKKHSRHYFTMFIANMENIKCKFANPVITRCLDPHDPTFYPSKHYDTDMP